jgi:hypothetical protein
MAEVGPMTITQDRLRGGGRAFTVALILGVAGLLLTAVGYWTSTGEAQRAVLAGYLVAFAYWVGIAVASSIWNAIFHASAARWMTVLRRVFESMAAAVPIFILLFLPIALGMSTLFPWVSPSRAMSPEQLELLTHKALYLNVPGFLVRTGIYFIIWIGVNQLLRGWSLRQDAEGGVEPTRRMRRYGSGAIPILGVSITFAAVDWLMSVDPFWTSTIFGAYYFAGSFLASIALLTLIAARTRHQQRFFGGSVTRHHTHNLGKLMLAFTAFWTYIAFSQFMLIWIANIPEEAAWYVVRMKGGWQSVGIFLIVTHFIIPFFTLLSRGLKFQPTGLSFMAVWILLVHWVDLMWLVIPALHPQGFYFHWTFVTSIIGVGGIAVAFALWRAVGHFTMPVKDPYLADSLRYTQP